MIGYLRLPLSWIAHSDRVGIPLMRVAIAIVFLWIGALKFAPYEADSITPFVANSPFMSFFYEHPTEYKAHLTREGELKPAERAWQTANNTYGFSDGLGTMEITIGLLTLLGVFSRRWGIVGATLSFLTPFVMSARPNQRERSHGFHFTPPDAGSDRCRRPPDDNHSLMASVERKPTSASRISEFHPSQNINRQETCNE